NPGVYQMEGRPSLLKLITIAGGLADNHGSTAFIIRAVRRAKQGANLEPSGANSKQAAEASIGSAQAEKPEPALLEPDLGPEGENYDLLQVNINGLFKGQFDQNMYAEPGDIVNIPPADVFFVAGEVQAPGSFPLKEGTTLRQAISLAQGTTFKAALGRGIIF